MMEIPASVVSSSVRRGDILLSEFANIDHYKYFVVMGVSDKGICGFFFINSNIHQAIFNKQDILAMQYQMKRSDYGFLRYDSFLCASSVQEKDLESISQGILDGNVRVIDRMKDEHIKEVIEMVRNSTCISERYKKLYFYND